MIIEAGHPDYKPGSYTALLDGVDVGDRCFYADDEAGEVRLYVPDPNSPHHPKVRLVRDGHLVTETRFGRVEIVPTGV